MVMHFKSCCCGCSLKTGTVIIGVLCAIGSLCALIMCIWAVSAEHQIRTAEFQKEVIEELEKERGPLSPAEYDQALRQLELITGSKTSRVRTICLAVAYALHLIFDILMLFGAIAERPRMIKPWLVYTTLLMVVQSIQGFVTIILLFIADATMMGGLFLVTLPVGIALGVYFILVVNSFHTELLSNNFQNKI